MTILVDKSPAAKRQARQKKRHSQTRTEVLDAAAKLVLNEGVSGFRLEALGDELGLTKQAIYYYFKSKESLLFELVLRENFEMASEVEAAIAKTETDIEGLEALMRTVFNRYRNRMDLYKLAYHNFPTCDFKTLVGEEALERVRPVNDMLYAAVETRLRARQKRRQFPKTRNPRRFVFNAHMAVIGILNMMSIAQAAQDPLIHNEQDLIDDIFETFKTSMRQGD